MATQIRPLVMALSLAAAFAASSVSAEAVKRAFIDPLSGPFAPVGQNILKCFQLIADMSYQAKWAGDNTIEVVGFDNKGSPQESLTQLKSTAK